MKNRKESENFTKKKLQRLTHSIPPMVRLGMGNKPSFNTTTSTQRIQFLEGTVDVHRFFFYFENLFMAGKADEEKAKNLLAHLEKSEFNFYYETFVRDSSLEKEMKNYDLVKQKTIDSLNASKEPQDIIIQDIEAALVICDIPESRKNIETLYEKYGFNDRAKYGLLSSNGCKHRYGTVYSFKRRNRLRRNAPSIQRFYV